MKSILLVEDDPFIRDLTSIKLSEQKYAVQVAHDGESALLLAKREQPDLILLDLDLPTLTGMEVLKACKEDPLLKNIPVVIFSNNDDPSSKGEAEVLGASAFFVKATTAFADLHSKIKLLIGE